MKIIIKGNLIAGTVTDDYSGPDTSVAAPEGFDFARLEDYSVVDGAVVKLPLWDFIKALRDKKVQSGGYKVVMDGVDKWFHSDTFSRTQQMGLVMFGASCPAVPWKTMDGSYVTMSQSLAGQIFAAAAGQDQALFLHAEVLKTSVSTSTTPESVDIDSGWPTTYLNI